MKATWTLPTLASVTAHVTGGLSEDQGLALEGSCHCGWIEKGNTETDLDVLTVEGSLGDQEYSVANDNLCRYANVGIRRFSSDTDGSVDDSATEPGFSGSAVVPTARGRIRVGLGPIDEMTFGGGSSRYFLQ